MLDDYHYQMEWIDRARRIWWVTWLVVLYVAVVLTIDTLAAVGVKEPIDWTIFRWRGDHLASAAASVGVGGATSWLYSGVMAQFDWFKFIFWFILPVLFSLRWMVWEAFSFKGWKKRDLFLLVAIGGVGLLVMFFILLVPDLRHTYPGMSGLSPEEKKVIFFLQIFWLVSWLPGWEFMHRYFLLDRVSVSWPWFGWLALPVFEGAYHLQKPGVEAIGMVIFSVFLTRWAMRRANVVLPFLAHLLIEIDLILFTLLIH